MINRKINMNHEEYGYFIDIETNTNTLHNFPDNLKFMNEKYKIRSINKDYYKINKCNINVRVNIMTTIPEINENSSHNSSHNVCHCSYKKKHCSYDKIAIIILLLCAICFKCYYFLHNFV